MAMVKRTAGILVWMSTEVEVDEDEINGLIEGDEYAIVPQTAASDVKMQSLLTTLSGLEADGYSIAVEWCYSEAWDRNIDDTADNYDGRMMSTKTAEWHNWKQAIIYSASKPEKVEK